MLRAPCFGQELLLVACEEAIKSYSLRTGEPISTLVPGESTQAKRETPRLRVLHHEICRWNTMQLVAGYSDGTVTMWDYTDGVALHTYRLADGSTLTKFASLKDGKIYGVSVNGLETKDQNSSTWKICEFALDNDTRLLVEKTEVYTGKGSCVDLKAGGKGDHHVAAIFRNELLWYDSKTGDMAWRKHKRNMVALAVHPTQECVATGDDSGQIMLWRRNTCSIVHWHASAVGALDFTVDGSYLLSGGEEGVLVLWQLGTSEKTFLPRLGGNIESISSSKDATRYAVAMQENTIHVIDAREMQTRFRIRGLATYQSQTRSKHKWLRSFVTDRRTDCVIVPSRPGILQFYNIHQDRHVYLLDVTEKNYVVRGGESLTQPIQVELVASGGKRLATIERRNKDIALKFWLWTNSEYKLVTLVNNPHEEPVVAMSFHPSLRYLVTASMDKTFKIWAKAPSKEHWACHSVGYYQNSKIASAQFSQDGSVLGIANESVVTIWDPLANILNYRLCHPRSDRVSSIEFFADFLLATMVTGKALFVWNLLQKRILWELDIPVIAISAWKNKLAALVEPNIIFVFEGIKAIPITYTKVHSDSRLLDVTFCSKCQQPLYSSESGSIEHVLVESSPEDTESKSEQTLNQAESLYSKVYGYSPAKPQVSEELPPIVATSSEDVLTTLDAYPSHSLPSLTKLYEAFTKIDASSRKRKAEPEESANVSESDEYSADDDSDSDDVSSGEQEEAVTSVVQASDSYVEMFRNIFS